MIVWINKTNNEIDKSQFYNQKKNHKPAMEWIPYSQIKNLEKIAEGGYGIIYKATWSAGGNRKDKIVAIKKFRSSQNIRKYFLNEVINYMLNFCILFKFYLFYFIF